MVALGWKLFMHSVRMLLDNLGPALRISSPLIAIAVVGGILAGVVSSSVDLGPVENGRAEFELEDAPWFVPAMLVVLVLFVFLWTWTAVAWHRYILLEDAPKGLLPPFRRDAFWSYLRGGILVFLAMMAILLGLLILFLIAVVIFRSLATPGPLNFLFEFILRVVLLASVYRVSLVLPGRAVGGETEMSQTRRMTEGHFGTLVVVASLVSLFNSLPAVFSQTVLAPITNGLVFQLCAIWITSMLSISILTTMYGYFIEKRALR